MISAVHADVINRLDNARLIGVTDHTRERAAAFAEKHGIEVFESTEALDIFIGQLQTFGSTQTQIVFSTAKEETSVELEKIISGEYPDIPEIK